MDKEIVKIILIIGMWDDYLDMINLMGKGDTSKESYGEIIQLCRRIYKGSTRNKAMAYDASIRILKSAKNG